MAVRWRYFICAFWVVTLLGGWAIPAAQAVDAPYFTWSAMQRFWNKQCPPGMDITSFSERDGGYVVNLRRGVILEVVMTDLRVSGLRLLFDSRVEEGGGPYFLLATTALIKVGAYGWPQEQVMEAYSNFEQIFPQPRSYEWGSTRFQREGLASGMWMFSMEYLLGK